VIRLLLSIRKEDSMARAYSNDLRERIAGAVDAGQPRRGAARQFDVSPSCAIKLVRRWATTASVEPGRQGAPKRYKLDPHAVWLLELVEAEPDITLEEIRARLREERNMTACIGTTWNFFDRHGISFKKNRARG
jgi:transposase